MLHRVFFIAVVAACGVFCLAPFAAADEITALKARVKALEAENRTLRAQLKATSAAPSEAVEEPTEPYEETSVAGFLGLAPKEKPVIQGGFIDLNYYHDDRDLNIFTVNLLANLPADIQYFSLTNFSAPADSKDSDLYDLSEFFTEQHFRRPIAKGHPWLGPLDWTVQYVDGSSAKDLVRLGTRVRLADIPGPFGRFVREKLGLWYNIDFHWYESDGEGYQIEHAYGGRYFDGFLTIGGFIDHDFDDRGENTVVTEHQIGFRIVENVYYVTEFKYNGNRGDADRWSTAFGVEYIIPF